MEDQDLEHEENKGIVEASLQKRFANYIIDYIVSIFIMSFIFQKLEASGYGVLTDAGSIRVRLLSVLLYALIYAGIEGITKGKTVGKMITKTRVMEYDGSLTDFDSIVVRSFCRIIPFEPLSFLISGSFWHDRFSKTIVIDEKLSFNQERNEM